MSKQVQTKCVLRTPCTVAMLLATLTMLGGLFGCSNGEGSFTVAFQWVTDVPAPGEFDVEGEIQTPDGGRLPSSPPQVTFTDSARLAFEDIPFGDELVVEVRFRPAGNRTGPVRYFGRSAPFSFGPGDNLVIPVDIDLSDAPGFDDGPGLTAIEVQDAVGGRIPNPQLRLRLRVRGAERIEIAQDPAFVIGLQAYDDLTPVERIDDVGIYELTYDLNETIEACRTPLGQPPPNCDGTRQIFARAVFVRPNTLDSLQSDAEIVPLVLDTTAPDILRGSVSYQPAPANVLAVVTAATGANDAAQDAGGTTVLLSVIFNEELTTTPEAPQVVASNGVDTLVFSPTSSLAASIGSATFSAVVDNDMHSDGVYVPMITMVDLVGNRADQLVIGGANIVVDSTPDPLVIAQSQVSYIRSPIGNASSEALRNNDGQDVYTLPSALNYYALGPPDGLDPVASLTADTFRLNGTDAPSALRVWADDQRGENLQRIFPRADGRWHRDDLRLGNNDNARLWVTGIDAAGNESMPVPIHNNWYIGSSALPPDGVTPHVTATIGGVARVTELGTPLSSPAVAASPDGAAARQATARTWRSRSTVPSPFQRRSHAMAYDTARERVVLFGGFGAASARSAQTWEWNGNQWTETTPEFSSPLARDRHAMVYSSGRGQIVMFGGSSTFEGELADTWTWNGERWTDVTPSTGNPPLRSEHAMAYDSQRGRVVLFGGQVFGNGSRIPLGDTWEWDGATWTELSPSTAPVARFGHAMAYDSQRGRVVLFGGADASGARDDVWEWDGTNWTEITSPNRPAARLWHSLVYDSAREAAVLFGGVAEVYIGGETVVRYADTWAFDGTTWNRLTSLRSGPFNRDSHAAAYDRSRDRVVLFGGSADISQPTVDGETWEWNGTIWSERLPQSPGARWHTKMAYLDESQQLLIYGGLSNFEDFVTDTWTWDGESWTDATASAGTPPPGRLEHALTYDPSRNRAVLFGGYRDESGSRTYYSGTWEYDGTEWSNRTPNAAEAPPVRSSPALAYDSGRNRVILFGGGFIDGQSSSGFNDLWEWDGTDWTDVSPSFGARPAAREDALMAYDPSSQRLLLYGGRGFDGEDVSRETWAWNGSSWTELTAIPTPQGQFGALPAAFVFDQASGRAALFGQGFGDQSGCLTTAWQWNGTVWIDGPPLSPLPFCASVAALAYDQARNGLVLFGGRDQSAFLADTWTLAPAERPSARFAATLPNDIPLTQVTDLRVRASCGGTHPDAGNTIRTGAELAGWATEGPGRRDGNWETLASNAIGTTIPPDVDLLQFSTPATGANPGARGFLGPNRRLYFQCRPVAGNAAGSSEVALDYAEVRVGYQTTD